MSDRAKAAYAAYGEVVSWRNFCGDPMPQFHELPESIQLAWDAACEGALRHWLDNEFRQAISDDKRVEVQGAYMLKVGHQMGKGAVDCVRVAIASFVADCIAPNAFPSLLEGDADE